MGRAVATGAIGPVRTRPLPRGTFQPLAPSGHIRHTSIGSTPGRLLEVTRLSRLQLSSRRLRIVWSVSSSESSWRASSSQGIAFPKRTFGKSKPVLCSAQSQWFNSWPFLHYDEGQDVLSSVSHLCHRFQAWQNQVQQQCCQSIRKCVCERWARGL